MRYIKSLLNVTLKMYTIPQEKAQCVSSFIETKSDVRLSETPELSRKRPTTTSFNSCTAQEMYGDRAGVR